MTSGDFRLYIGGGINYYQYKESNPIGDASENGLGYIGKLGGFLSVTQSLVFDVFVNYSYCKIQPADFEINIGGLEAGIGLGVEF